MRVPPSSYAARRRTQAVRRGAGAAGGRRLLGPVLGSVLTALLQLALPGSARADDWQVSRSEFDPRVINQIKDQLRRHPEDAALLRRLLGLYRRHSTLDKLNAELQEQAQRSGASNDYFLAAQAAKESGQLARATQLLEQAAKPGGVDPVKSALLLAELYSKHTPPDYAAAARQLEQALASLGPADARRKVVWRRQVELALARNDLGAAEQALRSLLKAAPAAEAPALRRELGELLVRADKPAEALALWRQLEAAPGGDIVKRAQVLLRIGELSEKTQDELAAIAAYRRGLAVLPAQHFLRRELYEHLIGVYRKRDELPQLLKQLEVEWPVAARSFADWELLGRLYDELGDTVGAMAAYRAALRRDPHSLDVRRRLIAILERSGVSAEVLAEYEQLINQAPGDSRAYLELAERLERSGQRARALQTLKRAAARFAGDPSLHSALADLYQRWGEAELALSESELLVRLDPREESYVVNLGELYWARGRKEKADEVWRRLLTLNANRALGQARLADVYAEHNLMPQALELYQKAVKAEPNNLQLRRGLAQASERMNRPREALTLWEQLYFAAKGPAERLLRLEARTHLANLIRKETHLLPAYFTWQRRFQAQMSQVAPEPLSPADLLALGLLVAEVSLKVEKVAEVEEVLTQLRGRFTDGPMLAEVLLALVPVYRHQHKLAEAIAALKQAAALLPERRRELYAQLAELSMQSYHDEEAIRYAQEAVADAQGELKLGELFERKDDVARAMAAYRRAIELDSRLFRAHMALARLHLQRGELAPAATIYREVVRRAPQEELVLEAGRKAIDLQEYLGTLGDLVRELSPLAFTSLPKPVYRKLLLSLYERYATPLIAQSRAGEAAAQGELARLGQSGLKPLTETLVDGDAAEQRVAITLLGELHNPSAAPALLNLVVGATAAQAAAQDGRIVLGGAGARPSDIDLRVDALLAAARLQDPRSSKVLVQLAQSREKHLRLAALYGLLRLSPRLEHGEAAAFELALADASPPVRALGCLGVGLTAAGHGLVPRARAQLVAVIERRRTRPEDLDELAPAACVHALGSSRDRSAVPLLIELLREGNDEVQRQAAWALGSLGDAAAVGPLLTAVFVKREPIRQAAVAALAAIASPASQPPGGDKAAQPLPPERRGVDGIDVAQLLSDAVTLTPPAPVAAPAWVQAPQLATQAVVAALHEPRDTTARTLSDLLSGRPAAREADKAAAPRPGRLGLGPLTAQLGSGPQAAALLAEVARGCLAELKPRLVGTGAWAADPQVLSLALQVLGVLGEHRDLEREVGTTLMHVLETAPQTALQGEAVLQAAAALAALPATALGPSPPPLLDPLVRHQERWVRLAILDAAAQPGLAPLLSDRALAQAAGDPDGYVRAAAGRLTAQRRPAR